MNVNWETDNYTLFLWSYVWMLTRRQGPGINDPSCTKVTTHRWIHTPIVWIRREARCGNQNLNFVYWMQAICRSALGECVLLTNFTGPSCNTSSLGDGPKTCRSGYIASFCLERSRHARETGKPSNNSPKIDKFFDSPPHDSLCIISMRRLLTYLLLLWRRSCFVYVACLLSNTESIRKYGPWNVAKWQGR
jgi:hypothetical protein